MTIATVDTVLDSLYQLLIRTDETEQREHYRTIILYLEVQKAEAIKNGFSEVTLDIKDALNQTRMHFSLPLSTKKSGVPYPTILKKRARQ